MVGYTLNSYEPWRCVLLAGLAYALACANSFSAPANDDFTNGTALSGSTLIINGALAGSTYEDGELNSPFHTSVGGSVWYTWSSPTSTPVVIEMVRAVNSFGSSNTFFSVYTNFSINNLALVDENTFDWPSGRYVAFTANPGMTYHFRVAGGWDGNFSLRLTATNRPVFLKQPADCVVSPFGSAFFTAMAAGPRPNSFNKNPVSYQWLSNGIPIPDEFGASLLVHEVTTNKIANYSVMASNAGGVTISSTATFSILNTNPIPRLVALYSSNSALATFTFTGEAGRWYKVESTDDLSNWPVDYPQLGWPMYVTWFKHTNETVLLSVPKLGALHYNRACLTIETEICTGQLKQLTWAQQLATIDQALPITSILSLSDLKPYIPVVPGLTSLRPCPEYGSYATSWVLTNPVTCSWSAHGHTIDAP